ncbi:MAG: 2-hydroxyacyl-CoA dehydratase family protein [Dehalococcoidia bacterium]
MEAGLQSPAFKQLWETAQSLGNPEIQKWKESGKKVAGYYCSAMPEELIAAAGMLPFRIRGTGSQGTDLADAFFSTINCTFSRHSFNQALRGEFDFLDAFVMLNSCDNVRRIYDHWIRQFETPFTHFLSLPKKAEQAQVEFFRQELALLKGHLEEHLGREISPDDIREAIRLNNETRRLLRQLYELRKSDAPPITGADTLAIVVASTAMPKARFNELLTEVLDELHSAEGITDYRARLMLVGGIVDDPGYVNVIEDQGGLVVTDSICFGSRNFWVDVDESDADPLMALASYYVRDRPSCPRTFGLHEKRADYIRDMIDQFHIDGIIFQRLTFCDVWGFEQFPLTNDLKAWDFPYLMMDREYMLSAVGQLRTRVQAFLETLGGR